MSKIMNKIEDDLIFYMDHNQCQHYQHYTGSKDNHCNIICYKIYYLHQTGCKFSNKLINRFMNYVFSKKNTRYDGEYLYCIADSNRMSYNVGIVGIYEIINIFMKYKPLDDLYLKELLENNKGYSNHIWIYNKCFNKLITVYPKYKFSENIVNCMITEVMYSKVYECNKKYLFDIIINNTDYTSKMLLLLCDCSQKYIIDKTEAIISNINKLQYKIKLEHEHLYKACKFLPRSKPLVQSIIDVGVSIDDKCLEIVCEYGDHICLEYILDSKIYIKKNHFQNAVSSKYYHNYVNLNRHEEIGDMDINIGDYQWKLNKLQILLEYGYELDHDDVIFSINNKFIIPDIEKYGIKPDKEILEAFYNNRLDPTYNFDCVSKSMLDLRKLCRVRALAKIKRFVNKHNIVPDYKCMEYACSHKNNTKVIQMLIEKGGTINIKCIRNCARFTYSNSLSTIIDNFEIKYIAEKNKYKKYIEELEKQIK